MRLDSIERVAGLSSDGLQLNARLAKAAEADVLQLVARAPPEGPLARVRPGGSRL